MIVACDLVMQCLIMKKMINTAAEIPKFINASAKNPSHSRFALQAGALPSTRAKSRYLRQGYSLGVVFGRDPKPYPRQQPLNLCASQKLAPLLLPSKHARTLRHELGTIAESEARCLGLKAKTETNGPPVLDVLSSRLFCRACDWKSPPSRHARFSAIRSQRAPEAAALIST